MQNKLEFLLERVSKQNPQANIKKIRAAYECAAAAHEGQKRRNGEPYIIHPVAVAEIVVEMGLDTDSICAALLHDCIEDTEFGYKEIENKFGTPVAELVDGVTRLGMLRYSKEQEQFEDLRKMFLAMAKDIRVILIKLADRLHNARTFQFLPERKQRDKAQETMEIYATIAQRLGMSRIKWELEDLSLKVLDPIGYNEIVEGLKGILKDIEEGNVEFSLDYEDIHMNVEQLLTERIGDTGKRLHTGRSRNDQVALDMRLYVKKEIKEIIELILGFMKALTKKSRENLDAVMPGYTHLQRAQPTTFAHYMMAYANMLKRDITRLQDCYERMDEMPLGSGALASTTYPIDRDFVREQLGFARLTDNSLDGVSDRDYCVELLSALSSAVLLSALSVSGAAVVVGLGTYPLSVATWPISSPAL